MRRSDFSTTLEWLEAEYENALKFARSLENKGHYNDANLWRKSARDHKKDIERKLKKEITQ